jgi:hypothetical protein
MSSNTCGFQKADLLIVWQILLQKFLLIETVFISVLLESGAYSIKTVMLVNHTS